MRQETQHVDIRFVGGPCDGWVFSYDIHRLPKDRVVSYFGVFGQRSTYRINLTRGTACYLATFEFSEVRCAQ